MHILHILKVIELKILIYHDCDYDTPIDAIPFDSLDFPAYCEECDNDIEVSDLEFGLIGFPK